MNVGCIPVHFCGVASPLGNMKDFTFLQILGKSVDWIEYLAKEPQTVKAYLASGYRY